MDNSPLISVITVTYNAAKVIKPTLESISGQAFTDFEHLVIDGKSADNTLDIIKSAGMPQTRIVSEPDAGLYDAMNKGLRLAKGKYVIFLNAGDAFHTPYTLKQYAQEALKGAHIIYGDTNIVDSNRKFITPRHLKAPAVLSKKSFSKGMLICHQAFMVKKDLADLYDTRYRFSADYDWCVKAINKSDTKKCVNINCVTIDYLSDGLTDKNKWKSLKERFFIMCRHYGFFTTSLRHLSFIGRAIRRKKL